MVWLTAHTIENTSQSTELPDPVRHRNASTQSVLSDVSDITLLHRLQILESVPSDDSVITLRNWQPPGAGGSPDPKGPRHYRAKRGSDEGGEPRNHDASRKNLRMTGG